ncbi:hypothetical protein [Limosilactobacillus panis]|jgi:hypothetical protein|uniref:hypothetical protein n=1 Tax=Limosilactobacillus panis TaxID=47493 RepID=UPI0021BC2FAA|nr:hypothetical protein [Limosilactobacillus panis]
MFNNSDNYTSNPIITDIFIKRWPLFKLNGKMQVLEPGIIIFPKDYFCYISKNKNANYAQHLFDNSWGTKNKGLYGLLKRAFATLFPYKFAQISAKRGMEKSKKQVDTFKLH